MKNSYRHWITARKVIQGVTLTAFLAFFIAASSGWLSPALINLGLRIDPLIALAQSVASRKILPGLLLGGAVLFLAFVFGRAWCGWICPLGTTLDLFPLQKRPKGKSFQPKDPPEKLRSLKYWILLLLLVAALWGNLTLLIFDPLTVYYRSLTVAFWPGLDQVIRTAEAFFYRLPFLSDAISQFDAWIRSSLLPALPLYKQGAFLFFAVFLGILALNRLAPRFWCRYLCPLGGMLGLISKVSLLRRKVSPDCTGCKLCSAACPTGTIDPNQGYASDPSECTLCLDCLEACPRSSVEISPILRPARLNPAYDPDRRQALLSLATATVAVALFQRNWLRIQPPPFDIRPPGADEKNLLSTCVRCGVCLRICPTGALQPDSLNDGLEGLWTPILVPRIGYCEFSCNQCGQVCPTQAIPSLPIEEKRQQVIGKAYIDQNHCLAWADHKDCIVCEEMCPLPEKAIYLKETEVTLENGDLKTIQLPVVQRDRCIGCGVCEYKCPLRGEAAIRVRSSI